MNTNIINDNIKITSESSKSIKNKKIKIDPSILSMIINNTIQNIETISYTKSEIRNDITNNITKNIKTEKKIELSNKDTQQSTTSISEEKNEYYYKNREKKLEYQKKYNREQGDKIKNYNKDYYQKRREEILQKAKTKITCECGCEVQLFNMNSHKKTKKHLKAIQAQVIESNNKQN
jgi:hypothetical protein